MRTDGGRATVRAFGGPRKLEKGKPLAFEMAFLPTPVKPLDTRKQFTMRYYHSPDPMDMVDKAGANVVNVHHANPLNLYINYPFLNGDRLSSHIKAAHERNKKVKVYYTVRELTNHVVEWAALRSLGTEVLADGAGGGYPWLREHFGDHYSPMWYDRLEGHDENGNRDERLDEVSAAVVTSGDSRWLNYYVEGFRWLLANMEIDGLYLDDVSYDRGIIRRLRSVIAQTRPGAMIDLHSNNQFSWNPANQYMEFLPYVDKIWFGEGFDYENTSPAYWLTEISGIPYGVMGEMLQGGGNPWRGMVYGITARKPWNSYVSDYISQVWKVWDDFGIADARMVGYWDKSAPVASDRPDVPVTCYVRNGKVLLALASWAPETVGVHLKIDWKALGIDPGKAVLEAPGMQSQGDGSKPACYQCGTEFDPRDAILVEPGKGWLLVLREKDGR